MQLADHLLLGDVADALGMQCWRVRRLIERGIIPEPTRLGRFRVFSPDDLPTIKAAAERAGYLKPSPTRAEAVPA